MWLRGSASCLILAWNVAAVARGGAAAVFQCRVPRPSAAARRGSGPTRSHKWPLQSQTSRQQRSSAACWQWRTRTTAIYVRVRKLLIACRFCRPTITSWRKLLHQFIMWWHFLTQIAMEKPEIGSVVWNSSCHIFMSAHFDLDTVALSAMRPTCGKCSFVHYIVDAALISTEAHLARSCYSRTISQSIYQPRLTCSLCKWQK